eukprot:CAMPEP_0114233574 /NCGR_PEP_ID=MMETSP0058-20121206/5238_1 /TAXON_ID=36894 /ORGANISM="Pyramimonas parkeae, CCMP726" /LENGTH=211 /DNA_ID=CAMNT_0001345175 /DNA_START=186 /DNA_END=821 /DNA_ORIENTATION=-
MVGLPGVGGWGVMHVAYELYLEYRKLGLQADPATCIAKANEKHNLPRGLPCVNHSGTFVIYSARDLQQAIVSPPPIILGREGVVQSLVKLELWKKHGHLYFKADSLAFSFAIPVLGGDNWQARNVSSILNTWMVQQSARWLSLMFYVGIAADHVGFTSAHPMIMKKHVYHEMHTMSIDSETLATLQVPGAQLDYREEFDRGEAPWYVLLSQ